MSYFFQVLVKVITGIGLISRVVIHLIPIEF